MASDNINQVGRYVKQTRKKADYALKRYKPDVPRIERIRDVFDPANEFSMTFDIKPGEDTVLLDLNFNKPPPTGGCNSDCTVSNCEQFDLGAGTHFITLEHPYDDGSLRVYDNLIAVEASKIDQTDRAAGQLSVQEITGEGIVVVCYTYSDPGCDFPDLFPTCPEIDIFHSSTHVGLAPVFVDRFDRTVLGEDPITGHQETSGHCGYWTNGPSPTASNTGTIGASLFNAVAHFENDRVLSDQWEMVVAGEMFNGNGVFQMSTGGATGFGAQLSYAAGQISLGFNYRFDDPDNPDPDFGNSYGFDSYFKAGTFTKMQQWFVGNTTPVKYFARFSQVNPGGWYFKIWKQTEDEPDFPDWSASVFDVPGDVNQANRIEAFGGIYVATFRLPNVTQVVAIWGGPGPGRGNHEILGAGDGITGYTLDTCRQAPDDGLVRFGFCSPPGTPDTKTVSVGGSESPSQTYFFSWPSFVEGPGLTQGSNQVTSKIAVLGRPASVRVMGDFKVGTFVDRTWPVVFESYGNGQPGTLNEIFSGTSLGGATSGGLGVWQRFDITVPCFEGEDGLYYYHWGVRLANPADSIVATLPRYEPPFLFANNAPIQVATRNTEQIPNGISDCSTGNFCPDNPEDYDARCAPLTNGNITLPYFCADIGENPSSADRSAVVLDGDGREVFVNREQGVDISTDGTGVMTVQYLANGIGTETIAPRCKRQSTTTQNGVTTSSNHEVQIIWPTMFDCTTGAEAYFELYMPNLPPIWNAGSEAPYQEITFGGQDNGPSIRFVQDQESGNSLDFTGTSDNDIHPFPLTENAWNSVKFRMEANELKLKFWVTGTAEPSAWDYTLTAGFLTGGNIRSWGLFGFAAEFDDESVYFKIKSFTANALLGNIPPSYNGGSTGGGPGPQPPQPPPGSGSGSPGSGSGSGGGSGNSPLPPVPVPVPQPPQPPPGGTTPPPTSPPSDGGGGSTTPGGYPATQPYTALPSTTGTTPAKPVDRTPVLTTISSDIKKITRVSFINGVRHAYPRTLAWNSDQSKILLGFAFPGRMLNGSTYADLGSFSQISQAEWSRTDPNKFYGVGGNVFYSQNATTGTLTALHTFAGLATSTQGNGYDGISIGDGEGAISDDDRWVALLGQTAGMGTQSLIVYDILNDTVHANITLGARPNNAQISHLGNYVVVGGGGSTRRYLRDLTGLITLTATDNHGDNGLDIQGNEIWVGNNAPHVVSYRLSDGSAKQLLPNGDAFEYGHVSGRNSKRVGWVYLSVYDNITTAGRYGVDQIVAVKTDGSAEVELFGYANNHHDGSVYASQTHASASPDGKKVIFASTWSSNTSDPVHAYIAEAPPPPPPPVNPIPPPPPPPPPPPTGGIGSTGPYTASGPINITSSNTTIEGKSFSAPQSNGGLGARTIFIQAHASAGSPYNNITIRNCTFNGGTIAIWLQHCTNVTVENCTIRSVDYAGVMFWSVINGFVRNNDVQKIGYNRTDFSDPAFLNNAYGIILNRNEGPTLGADPHTQNVVVDHNIVRDSPIWMGLNGHGGVNNTYSNNTVSGAPRAIFNAGSPPGFQPSGIKIINNNVSAPVTKPGGTTNVVGILYASWNGGQITGNTISSAFEDKITDYQGQSVNVIVSGNVIV